jgi:hypothetical protein
VLQPLGYEGRHRRRPPSPSPLNVKLIGSETSERSTSPTSIHQFPASCLCSFLPFGILLATFFTRNFLASDLLLS